MDKQDYLNQISATSKPPKQAKKGILGSIYFKLGVGAIAALIVILILGSVLSGNKGSLQKDLTALKLHIDYTVDTISAYQTNVKSSILRSSSASLHGILSNTDGSLTRYLEEKYGFKEKNVDEETLIETQTARENLLNDLFKAKINGNLDRIYAHKMTYEIAIIASNENSILKQTKDEDLISILSSSYNSLNNLYSQFNDFSEAK